MSHLRAPTWPSKCAAPVSLCPSVFKSMCSVYWCHIAAFVPQCPKLSVSFSLSIFQWFGFGFFSLYLLVGVSTAESQHFLSDHFSLNLKKSECQPLTSPRRWRWCGLKQLSGWTCEFVRTCEELKSISGFLLSLTMKLTYSRPLRADCDWLLVVITRSSSFWVHKGQIWKLLLAEKKLEWWKEDNRERLQFDGLQ